MRRFVVVVALVVGFAAPAAADTLSRSPDQMPVCVEVSKRPLKESKVRRMCGAAPDAEVTEYRSRGKWVYWVRLT